MLCDFFFTRKYNLSRCDGLVCSMPSWAPQQGMLCLEEDAACHISGGLDTCHQFPGSPLLFWHLALYSLQGHQHVGL